MTNEEQDKKHTKTYTWYAIGTDEEQDHTMPEEKEYNLVYCAIVGFFIILFLMYFDLLVTK
jgi:hypothetical protein